MMAERLTRILQVGKRRRLAGALAMLLAFVLAAGLLILFPPLGLLRSIANRYPDVLFLVTTNSDVVALTIDDGPTAHLTPEVLRILGKYDAHATFFLLGERAKINQDLVRQMLSSGHEVGHHMMRDRRSAGLPAAEFEREFREMDALLDGFGGATWFRPGSGWFSEDIVNTARAYGYRTALGSVYPLDLVLRSPALISLVIRWNVRPGRVIVLHEGGVSRSGVTKVLDSVLSDLTSRGFRVVTLTQLEAYSEETERSGP